MFIARFEVFTVTKIQGMVHFLGADGGNKVLQNFGTLPHQYTTLHFRRSRL